MYAAVCAYQAALLQERGFTNSQAGMVIAVRCLAGIVCQPLLGGLADRRPDIPLRRIVGLSLAVSLGAGICLLLFPEMGPSATAWAEGWAHWPMRWCVSFWGFRCGIWGWRPRW